jgi:hypothetical protein
MEYSDIFVAEIGNYKKHESHIFHFNYIFNIVKVSLGVEV